MINLGSYCYLLMFDKIRIHPACHDSKMHLWEVWAQKMKSKSLFWLFGHKYTLLLNPALPAISMQGSCADTQTYPCQRQMGRMKVGRMKVGRKDSGV